ncbi:MAG TPA: hypothetical protein VHB18_00235 [Mycobacteriales bacterium]|nr:hypothetical protein [Mycobacteriales bacterium]
MRLAAKHPRGDRLQGRRNCAVGHGAVELTGSLEQPEDPVAVTPCLEVPRQDLPQQEEHHRYDGHRPGGSRHCESRHHARRRPDAHEQQPGAATLTPGGVERLAGHDLQQASHQQRVDGDERRDRRQHGRHQSGSDLTRRATDGIADGHGYRGSQRELRGVEQRLDRAATPPDLRGQLRRREQQDGRA